MKKDLATKIIEFVQTEGGEDCKIAVVVWGGSAEDTSCLSNEKDVVQLREVLGKYIKAIDAHTSIEDMEMM